MVQIYFNLFFNWFSHYIPIPKSVQDPTTSDISGIQIVYQVPIQEWLDISYQRQERFDMLWLHGIPNNQIFVLSICLQIIHYFNTFFNYLSSIVISE